MKRYRELVLIIRGLEEEIKTLKKEMKNSLQWKNMYLNDIEKCNNELIEYKGELRRLEKEIRFE